MLRYLQQTYIRLAAVEVTNQTECLKFAEENDEQPTKTTKSMMVN
jgi:hypothetical protein